MLLNKLLSNLTVEVKPFAVCQVSEGWRLRLPGPTGTMLHFVLEGSGTMLDPKGEKHALKPFSLSVVPKGMPHSLEPFGAIGDEVNIDAPPTGEQVCHIVAGPSNLCRLSLACGLVQVRYGESLGLFDYLHEILTADFSDAPYVMKLFSRIIEEQENSLSGSKAMTAALMTECVVHLLRYLTDSDREELPWLMALEDSRLAKAIDRILEDPTANHSVESLAVAASMSRSAFAEKFSAAFGRTPMQFVHHLRMAKAAKLLSLGDLSIDEVAHRVNYASRSQFSESFKKHFGTPPTAYRSA